MTHGFARPTVLPPCPSWCSQDHDTEIASAAVSLEERTVWRLCHRHQIGQGTTPVVLYQDVDIRTDGSVLHSLPPDLGDRRRGR